MDFNTQRRVVKSLREKGRNPLLFIPCYIASLAVILFMTVCRGADMALSDSKGNFLGIKRKNGAKRKKDYGEVPVPAEKPVKPVKKRSETDFTEKQLRRISGRLPYRSLFKRFVSAAVAAAFTFMCMPEFAVSAAGGSLSVFPVGGEIDADITVSDVEEHEETYGKIRRVDLRGFASSPILHIENGAFNNKPTLTTVLAAYTHDVVIGNNFSGIAPDAVILITAASAEEFSEMQSRFTRTDSSTQIIWDPGTLVNSIPMAVSSFNAKSGVGGVFLEWDAPYDSVDGYKLYSLDRSTGVYGSIETLTNSAVTFSGGKCSYFCPRSNDTSFAIRAYKDVFVGGRTVRLFSETFTDAPVTASPMNTSKPFLAIEQDNRRVYVKISYTDAATVPDYTVLYRSDSASPTGFVAIAAIQKNLFVNGLYSYADERLFPAFSGERRTYVAAAHYDPNRPMPSAPSSYTYNPNGFTSNDMTVINSDKTDVSPARLNPPRSLRYQLVKNSAGERQWNFQWDPPEFRSDDNAARQNLSIVYELLINSETVARGLTETNKSIVVSDIPRSTLRDRFTAQVRAYSADTAIDISPSLSDVLEIPLDTSNTVMLNRLELSGEDVCVIFSPLEGSNFYTINYTYIDGSTGRQVHAAQTASASECGTVNGMLVYTLKGLLKDTEYTVYVSSDAPGSVYDSAYMKITVPTGSQPGVSPVVPGGTAALINIRAETEKQSIKLTWDKVDGATGYRLYRTGGNGVQFPSNGNSFWSGKENSFTDTMVSYGCKYDYSVVAVKTEGTTEKIVGSSRACTVTLEFNLKAVQGLAIRSADKAVRLEWEKVDNADGYYVQYRDENGTWITAANVSGTSCTVSNMQNNETRDFRVVPFSVINGTAVAFDEGAMIMPGKAGVSMPCPLDFEVTAGEGQTELKWSAVDGAEGYEIYVVSSRGTHTLDRVSKTSAIHKNIPNGTTITYMVRAFKYVDGEMIYGDNSITQSVTVGVVLNAPTDVEASSSGGSIDLKWKKVNNADGYVVYTYNTAQMKFTPIGIVTSEGFTHSGLQDGRDYTYMIAAYKNMGGGDPLYSGYSLSVTAKPGAGTVGRGDNSSAVAGDRRIYITGTTPYGMTNSNLIAAFTEKGAFDTDIDVRFTNSPDTVRKVQRVLNFYGEGIESFMIYPMDIALYEAGTDKRAYVKPGYYMTITIPVPDELLPYSEHISVVHVSDLDQLEILPSIHVDVGGVDCVQFNANSFSPYAFVVYMNEVAEDTGAGTAAAAEGSADMQTSASPAFRCTYLADIYRRRIRNKVFRIVK